MPKTVWMKRKKLAEREISNTKKLAGRDVKE
jgi:hypothetical protein